MENLTENNKLISEFMGIEPKDIGAHWQWSDGIFFSVREQSKNKALEAIYKYVKYHTSWDWLMPVVEKIINLKEVYAQERQKVFESIKPQIEITYKTVIEFIKWYNQNKTV